MCISILPKPAHPKQKNGFTLVEILVVVSIIGLLLGLSFPAVTGAIQTGKKTEVAAVAESIKTAISAFYAEYSSYPTNTSGQIFTNTDANFLTALGTNGTNFGNSRGISFLEIPIKFTNQNGIVTPKGFYAGNRQSNFMISIDLQQAGTVTNRVGSSNYVVPASISVWVTDPKNPNKPLGTFR
ncbi:type II secretion system protein [bacterium]|nr:type II secretion system protein [bacterium]